MTAASALIAEDEPLLRAEIRKTLQDLWPELVICAEAGDGSEAICAIERFAPDIVFLDIHMPGMDGLAVAEKVSGTSHVVFITAYDQHTLAAFECGAIDYVLKPISIERMRKTVARLRESVQPATIDRRVLMTLIDKARDGGSGYIKWLTVGRGPALKLVTVGDICYLRADHKYTSLVTNEGEFLLTIALKDIKEKLDPDMFWQIHRSIIVNVSAIASVFRSFRGSLEVKLKDRKELLPVSAAHGHLFRQL